MTTKKKKIESHPFERLLRPMNEEFAINLSVMGTYSPPPPPIRTEVKFAKNAHIFKTNTKKSKNKKVNILYTFLLFLQIKIGWTY